MKVSCGAIFYTYDPYGNIGIILGLEGDDWLPFKGCNEKGETYEETAIREIYEETCGLIRVDKISLDHAFASKRKKYYIGLIYVDYDIIEKFSQLRKAEDRPNFIEKKSLRFFNLDTVLFNNYVHGISKASIKYYWNKLEYLRPKMYNENNENENIFKIKFHITFIPELYKKDFSWNKLFVKKDRNYSNGNWRVRVN